MEFEMQPYKVYIKIDEQKRIIAINSDAFIAPTDEWIYIDEGYGDKYHHAQGNYLPKSLMDSTAHYNYSYPIDTIVERTEQEKEQDYNRPEVTPSEPSSDPALINRILELEAQLAAYESAYAQGVNEA